MGFEILEMSTGDYGEVAALWQATDGVCFDEDDAPEKIEAYLARNPGLSFVARSGGRIVGAVLCGTDGRRGYLHHLAVARAHRRRGVGKALVDRCFSRLASMGIPKCHIFVFSDNPAALEFWKHTGWRERDDLHLLSKDTPAADST